MKPSVVAAVVCATLGLAGAAAAGVSLGMAATEGPRSFAAKAGRLGIGDHATLYHTLGDPLPYDRERFAGADIVLVLKLPDGEGGLLSAVRNGAYDRALIALGTEIRAAGRTIHVRPFYEGNGDWHPWGAYAAGNDPADFVPAFRRLVDSLRDGAAGHALIDLNYNRRSARRNGTSDFDDLYPGDAWVDRVSISSYNRCGTAEGRDEQRSFAEEFAPAYDAVTAFTDRPLAVAETATTELCGGDQVDWYRAMLASLESDFPRVESATFFFERVATGGASNDRAIDWGIRSSNVPRFRALIDEFRGSPASPAAPSDGTVRGSRSYSLPWSVNGNLTHFSSDTPNPALNPESGNPFGRNGTVLRVQAWQGVVWRLGRRTTLGPRFGVELVQSDNDEMWWNNAIDLRAELNACRETGGANGRLCAFVGLEQVDYTVDAPPRYDEGLLRDGGDSRVRTGMSFSFGGDWK